MDSDRLTQLEQRLALVEMELATSRRMIEAVRQGTTRARLLGRLTSSGAICGLIALLAVTAGSATAAPAPKTLTVKAPFNVVAANGEVIFQVSAVNGRNAATIYAGGQHPVAELRTTADGKSGQLLVTGDTPQEYATFGGYSDHTALVFDTAAGAQAGMGSSPKGGILQVNDTAGNVMAKLSNNGTSGTVGIYNTAGKTKGLLATDTASGDAEFDLFYADGTTPAVKLSEVAAGGYFALTNRQGIQRVEAGVLPSDQGILRAFGPGGFDYVRGMK